MGSHKNKSIREKLEAKYGCGCMFRNAHIAERIEAMGGIKTYKEFLEEHKYKLKKIIQLEKQMSLHHLKHRSEEGHTSEYNGAVINSLAHAYLHSLPREQEEIINNMLREHKRNLDNAIECKIELVDDLDTGIEIKYTEISFPEPKKGPKEIFSRARAKAETRKRIEEDLEI